jgi:hypothetical protein
MTRKMGNALHAPEAAGVLEQSEDDEPTAVASPVRAKKRCGPCGGTGELVAQFSSTSAVSRRLCVACGGIGLSATPARVPATITTLS